MVIVGVFLIFLVASFPKPFCKENQKILITLDIKEAVALKESNISFIYVNGTSMLPTIKNGSVCVCAKKKSYAIGDIVIFPFVRNNHVIGIVHRINNTNDEFVFTKGDNNKKIDAPVPKEEIICYVPEIPFYLKLFF